MPNQKNLIKINNPTDKFCLFYSLEASRLHTSVGQPGGLTRQQFYGVTRKLKKSRSSQLPCLWDNVERMMRECGIARDMPDYSVEEHVPLVQGWYNREFPGQYRIIAFDEFGDFKTPIFKGPDAEYDVCIINTGDHFEGVRCVNTLFGKSYYCPDCQATFGKKIDHTARCKRYCRGCEGFGRGFPCPSGQAQNCGLCNQSFASAECYQRHLATMCARFHRCKDCGATYDVKAVARLSQAKKHECGTTFCMHCNVYHKKGQECYIQPLVQKDNAGSARFIGFDFEATQVTKDDPAKERFLHEVNFVAAFVVCTECAETDAWKDKKNSSCAICGPNKTKSWSSADGVDPLQSFIDWLITGFDPRYPTYAFSHYGSRYDMQCILNHLLTRGGICPEVIRSGHKLFEIYLERQARAPAIHFRDSYLFMPQALSDLVEGYGLTGQVQDKPFFPHMFNTPRNYYKRLKHLPQAKYYMPDSMKPEKRKAFYEWYEQNKDTPFCLEKVIREYCKSDVDILVYAMMAFRKEWLEVTGDDAFRTSITIASACMRHFRLNHMMPNTLLNSPDQGFEKHSRQSVVALQYLKWYEKRHGVAVRHRDSAGGEYELKYVDAQGHNRHLYLDGYVERHGQRPLAIEVYGCAYHGCLSCYYPDVECPNGKTAQLNHDETMSREAVIRQHFDLHTVWECEIRQALKDDQCGSCARCRNEGDDENEISYMDIVSLYPATNYYSEYPLGAADVHVLSKPVHWDKPEDIQFKGLYKVMVLPPRSLLHPVLPIKFGERLLFPLCKTCCLEHEKTVARVNGYRCTHKPEQRQFATTVTHAELQEALQNKYVVTYVDRVWHWDRWSADIFKPYVRQFMKIKLEATGYPKHLKTDKEKEDYVKQNEAAYGIKLDANNIKKNPAKRSIAKLCLNSLWGRFGIRSNLTKTTITKKPHVFCELASDKRLELHTAEMVSDEAMYVTYKHKKDFVKEAPTTNLFVSLFTTSYARLRLYRYMRMVADAPGCELLYTREGFYDTDSIIYKHPKGQNPVPEGMFLGEMSREEPGYRIVAYYSGGAKQYALKLISCEDGSEKYILKLRGITLDYRASKKINFESFKQQVLNYGQIDPIFVDVTRFDLDRMGNIHTGIVTEDFRILPFGYCETQGCTYR